MNIVSSHITIWPKPLHQPLLFTYRKKDIYTHNIFSFQPQPTRQMFLFSFNELGTSL